MKRQTTLMCLGVLCLAIAGVLPLLAATTHTMKDGDTLWDLANKFYGDPTLYPVFLEVNKIDNVRTIPTGKVLIVPSLDEIKKVSKEHDPVKRKELINNLGGSNSSNSSSRMNEPLIVRQGQDSSGKPIVPGNSYVPGTLMKDSFGPIVNSTVDPNAIKKVETPKK